MDTNLVRLGAFLQANFDMKPDFRIIEVYPGVSSFTVDTVDGRCELVELRKVIVDGKAYRAGYSRNANTLIFRSLAQEAGDE